jgi:SAM-dependent methyltransferase
MPSMFEIYEKHAVEYDQLVDAEDYQGNFGNYLRQVADWEGKTVLEAGVGTGRVTQLYADLAASAVCFDQSPHMLEAAKRRLSRFGGKISYRVGDNLKMPEVSPKCDIFVEGWSWGHSVVGSSDPVATIAEALIRGVRPSLKPDAVMMVVETMGTNTATPAPPEPRLDRFYKVLVNELGFHQAIIRTDYRFATSEDAIRIMGFFFGETMEKALADSRPTIVTEWTGVWHRRG